MKKVESLYKLVHDNIEFAREDGTVVVNEHDLHHNVCYGKRINLILNNGILSFNNMVLNGILDKNIKQAYDNVNGVDWISVSEIVKPEDKNERYWYYEPNCPTRLDFVIDKKIYGNRIVRHNSENYDNELLVNDSIPVEYIKQMRVRLLGMLEEVDEETFKKNYNFLVESLELLDKLHIPLIEDSKEDIILNPQKLLSLGKMK